MRDLVPDAPAQAARRDLLRLLLLAPAAAACASARPAGRPAGADPGEAASPQDPAEALRAVREHPLPPGAEPALVFRALGPRGR
ncbi:MAG TPA: hypothetical protein VLS93_18315 [Anaeromyxobacteraceae bacterium]|nr:hypothetical protein [Anaeromyxobacteraceae bacterium]